MEALGAALGQKGVPRVPNLGVRVLAVFVRGRHFLQVPPVNLESKRLLLLTQHGTYTGCWRTRHGWVCKLLLCEQAIRAACIGAPNAK